VTELVEAIAQVMGIQEEIEGIRLAASIHDIGKIAVPGEILCRPSSLGPLEMQLIRTHSQAGYDILKDVEFPWPIARILLQHHEREQGSGYPQGLKFSEISIGAKIIAVADVVEAMVSHRPYRPAWSLEQALQEIKQNRGTLYHPEVVDACLQVFERDSFDFKATTS
jgi:HD-GYP domain-containing protein (c-di-GMP phosphodiesterase class II)